MTEIKTKLELALIGKYFDSYPEKSISILEELSAQDIINTIQYFSTKDITRIISQMRTDKASDTLIALPEDIFRDVYSSLYLFILHIRYRLQFIIFTRGRLIH